jgi:hypothetical protein
LQRPREFDHPALVFGLAEQKTPKMNQKSKLNQRTSKHATRTGLMATGLALLSTLGAHAAPVVMLNEATFATSGTGGWFTSLNPVPQLTGGSFLNIRLDDPTNAYAYKVAAIQTLQLGESLELTFDIARTSAVRGDLYVSLIDTTNTGFGFGFNASLGTAVSTSVSRTQYQTRKKFYTGGSVASLVGTNISTGFTTYKFTIERIANDALWFKVSQGGTVLQSTIKTYDGTDQAANEMLTTFNRVLIGWGDTLLSQPSTESIKIDNVKLEIVPVSSTQALWTDYITSSSPRLNNWSEVGYKFGKQAIPNAATTQNVTTYGAVANDSKDDTVAVQKAIDAAQAAGGGVVSFPAGQFDFQVGTNNSTHALKITKSNIVIRGSGSGTGGTVLKQWTHFPNGTDYKDEYFLIDATGPLTNDSGVKLAENAAKNSRQIKLVSGSQAIKTGDVLRLELISSVVNGVRDPALNEKLVAPLSTASGTIESNWTAFNGFTAYSLNVQVKSVEADGVTVNLEQALPRTFETTDGARVRLFTSGLLSGVGVEKLKILGAFDSATYVHHKDWENDYGWNGIHFEGVIHSWIRDVVLDKMLQEIVLGETMNCTVDNIKTLSRGHSGVGMGWSYYNLVQNYQTSGFRSHVVSAYAQSVANVFTGINNASGNSGDIDFHGGGRSHCNLVENSTNLRVGSGGDPANMPHAGQFNTFWNITAGAQVSVDDFFTSGLYGYSGYAGSFALTKLHQLYPKSILVGIGNQGAQMNIGNSKAKRDDAWLYVDCPGGSMYPQSLYQAQKKLGK